MEKWEKDLRAKLELEFDDGMYRIGVPPMVALTGKQGKIDFEVMLEKMSNEIKAESIKKWGPGIQNQIDNPQKTNGTELTDQTIIDFMNEIRNNCKP